MRVLRVVGKLLISMGVGVLLFVAWTLWGTGFYTADQQNRLAQEFDSAPKLTPTRTNRGTGGVKSTGPPKGFSPDPGDPVFKIDIPAIDVHQIVVEGVDTAHLRTGPGHYPTCRDGFVLCIKDFDNAAWPGEQERVIVSGHRTTYGAPFWDLDKLEQGDDVMVETRWGDFVYKVTEKAVVEADSRAVVIPGDEAEMVLTTCNPKFSASQRLVVYTELDGEESA
jgi:sortase A